MSTLRSLFRSDWVERVVVDPGFRLKVPTPLCPGGGLFVSTDMTQHDGTMEFRNCSSGGDGVEPQESDPVKVLWRFDARSLIFQLLIWSPFCHVCYTGHSSFVRCLRSLRECSLQSGTCSEQILPSWFQLLFRERECLWPNVENRGGLCKQATRSTIIYIYSWFQFGIALKKRRESERESQRHSLFNTCLLHFGPLYCIFGCVFLWMPLFCRASQILSKTLQTCPFAIRGMGVFCQLSLSWKKYTLSAKEKHIHGRFVALRWWLLGRAVRGGGLHGDWNKGANNGQTCSCGPNFAETWEVCTTEATGTSSLLFAHCSATRGGGLFVFSSMTVNVTETMRFQQCQATQSGKAFGLIVSPTSAFAVALLKDFGATWNNMKLWNWDVFFFFPLASLSWAMCGKSFQTTFRRGRSNRRQARWAVERSWWGRVCVLKEMPNICKQSHQVFHQVLQCKMVACKSCLSLFIF